MKMQKETIYSKYKNIRKVFFPYTFVLFLYLLPSIVSAGTLSTKLPQIKVGVGETFSVPVYLSAPENVNAVLVTISYPSDLVSFVGTDDTGSFIPLWIERPHLEGSIISFSGTIPGGFTEILDPLSGQKTPGILTTLIFKPLHSGVGAITTVHTEGYLNNGVGTPTNLSPFSVGLTITEEAQGVVYETRDDRVPPESFTLYESTDVDMFNGDHFIAFSTTDRGSGIDHYEVKEGNSTWRRAESPYRLEDQSLSKDIFVKAFDKAGNTTIAKLLARHPGDASYVPVVVVALLVFGGLLFLIIYRRKNKDRVE